MDNTKVKNIVNEVLESQEAFLVDLKISTNNKISVWADSLEGMTIERLKMISRKVEGGLDREEEDFELTVSSPGLDQPLKVFNQYVKNIGRSLMITTNDEETLSGKLIHVEESKLTLETTATKKVASEVFNIPFDDIKETKVIIAFK